MNHRNSDETPAIASPSGRSFHAHLGQLVHRAVATCLTDAKRLGRDPIDLRRMVVARVLELDPLRADRRRGFLLLGSMVDAYLRRYNRPAPWTLLAAERRTSSGRRIDLLFGDTTSGEVVADELKTASVGAGYVTSAEREQLSAYFADLRHEFGRAFVGVRLVHLGPPSHATLYATEADLAAIDAGFPARVA